MLRTKSLIKSIFVYGVLGLATLFTLFPLFWGIISAFKPREIFFANPPVWIFKPTLMNFKLVFADWLALDFLRNSIIITTGATLLSVAIGTPAAYALTRLDIRGRESIAMDILSIRMFPPIVVAVPIFLIAFTLGLINTYLMVILVYTVFNMPLTIWVMRSFILDMPVELEESALVDGCSRFQTFLKIVLPLCKPGLVAVAILNAMFSWNEFLFATVLTRIETRTIPVIAAQTMTQRGIEWGPACALTLITIIPVLMFTIIIQKYLVRGLTLGAVKG